MKIYPIAGTNRSNFTHPKFGKKSGMLKSAVKMAIPALLLAYPPITRAQTVIPPTKFEIMADTDALPYYLQPEYVNYTQEFNMDNKTYTMVYADYYKKITPRENVAAEIYFIPDDYRLITVSQTEVNAPPKLEKLVKNENADGTSYLSVIISEITCDKDGKNSELKFKEITLPENITRELHELYQGKTEYTVPEEKRIIYNAKDLNEEEE